MSDNGMLAGVRLCHQVVIRYLKERAHRGLGVVLPGSPRANRFHCGKEGLVRWQEEAAASLTGPIGQFISPCQ